MGRRTLWARRIIRWPVLGMLLAAIGLLAAQRPPLRRHRATVSKPVQLVPASETPPAENQVAIRQSPSVRVVTSNAVPEHRVGQFPNRGNPHHVRPQRLQFQLPAAPQPADQITPLHLSGRGGPPNLPFGIAVNGVLFDPGTAEYWRGDRRADWNYEALGGAVALGLDENWAHVQPGGSYHYHGLPKLLLLRLGVKRDKHSPLVGWAADGFPIYARFGYQDPLDPDSPIVELKPSYRLKSGERPAAPLGPGGKYDGTFIRDYEFVAGLGDLDECNGRRCRTPEFPEGTYAYFLTTSWPVIPRAFRGTPVRLR